MTTGASGTYAINNTNFTLQPSDGKWLERQSYGFDGSAHPIYSALRSFEASWDIMSTDEAKQLIDFYNGVAVTGAVVACLPKWGDVDYIFYNYSGTTLGELTVGEYFQGYIKSTKLLLYNIRT